MRISSDSETQTNTMMGPFSRLTTISERSGEVAIFALCAQFLQGPESDRALGYHGTLVLQGPSTKE